MEVVLIRVTEKGEKTPVPLTRERTMIGRLDDCHIRIPAPEVSRNHCEIVVEDGTIEINDLGSSNGTFVNQERVSKRSLDAGDLVSVGGMVFVVTVDGQPREIIPTMMYEDGLPEAGEPASPSPASKAPEPALRKVPASSVNEDSDASDLSGSLDMDDSSMMDFEFDFDDDDDQPPL